MKTTNSQFLAEQIKDVVENEFRIELFQQWTGAITNRDSAAQIKVSGDATGLLANGATFIIALDDFETEHIITSATSYDGGTDKTTIICSASSFLTTVVGLEVALKINITDYILEDGFSPIRIATEGETLNEFLADDVTVQVDNSDNYFYDPSGSGGIFNNDVIFWLKIIFKLRTNATEFLCFGGVIFRDYIQPINESRDLEFTAMGHLKELERYPGFWATDELGDLPNITGIELISLIEQSGGTYEGIRDLKYKFPDGVDIKGLKINSISDNTPIGWHVIKFQPPDLFQYDYGSWTQLTEDSAGETLTSDEGHTIDIDTPNTFDLIAREDLISVINEIAPEVDKIGKPTLQFSNGIKTHLKYDFERVIRYDATAAAYYDITREAMAHDIDEVDLIEAVNDVIYIMSPKPFYGIYWDLADMLGLDAALNYDFSQGFNDWGSLNSNINDETWAFRYSGTMIWDPPSSWRQCDLEINSVRYEDYYCLRITCINATGAPATLKRAFRHFLLLGEYGNKLEIKAKYEKLQIESKKDDIILVEDSSDVKQPCVWQQNMSFQAYLESLLDSLKYTSGYRTIDDLKIESASKIISLYGKPPRNLYDKQVTALCIDTSTSPETIYLGIEDELWKVTEAGEFEYIDCLRIYHKPSGTGSGSEKWIKVKIRRLVIDGNGYLQGVAWDDYDIQYANEPEALRAPAIVFRSTNKTAITEQNQIDSSNLSFLAPGTRCFRMGHYEKTDGNFIGQNSFTSVTCGENIIIPFPQIAWEMYCPNFNGVVYDVNGLTGTTVSGGGRNYVGSQERFFIPPGHYFINDNQGGDGDIGDIGFCMNLGAKGFVTWNETLDKWMCCRWDGTNFDVITLEYDASVVSLLNLAVYQNQPIAADWKNDWLYFSLMTWQENGGTFPADLGECDLQKLNNDGSIHTVLFEFAANSVEANQSLATGDEPYCVILDLVCNTDENTIHGCLLNRDDFEYHYFVYDIANDKLYTSQTGSGFTYNSGRQIKEFLYNSNDDKIYAVVTDPRYNEETAFLISAEFIAPGGAPDGTEITLTKEADIVDTEHNSIALALGGSGRIYGITAPDMNYLFQYDDNFYPRFFLANVNELSYRDILTELAEAMNMIVSIDPNRKIHFSERETNKGSMTIYEATHYLEDTMSPVFRWQNYYDGVEVSWENPFTGEKGKERAGNFGWQRRILEISNPFIQYPQLAKLIAEKYNTFFSALRRMINFKTIQLWQLDNRDKFTFNHSINNFEFQKTVEWMIDELELDYWGEELKIKGIEKS